MSEGLSRRLRQVPEFELGVTIPEVLSKRLDLLVSSADEFDVPTRRKEVIAALVLGAPAEVDALRGLLAAYREAEVRDAAVDGASIEDLLPRKDTKRRGVRKGAASAPGVVPTAQRARLVQTATRRIGLSLPEPLSARLDVLLDRLRTADESTTRQEIVAALILAAPSGAALAEAVQQYRAARVADAVVPDADADLFVNPLKPLRGPRPRAPRPSSDFRQ